jgi:hypothetical protein
LAGDFLFSGKIELVTEWSIDRIPVSGCQNCRFASKLPALVSSGEVSTVGIEGTSCPEIGCGRLVFVSWEQMGGIRLLPPYFELFAVAVSNAKPRNTSKA